MICPHCKKELPEKEIAKHFAALGGSVKSDAKTKAARENIRKRWAKKPTTKGGTK